ncbi:class I SAM-dependent methyltransferase [Roseibium album]|uniref:class I SAM-dependent methyltransferase n=1 Tax=Roseibium album TaxID=311410 RepID=UPI0024920B6E|nr:class I SAM-dependent methyltransferase [Roseibium album]
MRTCDPGARRLRRLPRPDVFSGSRYARSHSRWLRHAGGEAQCAIEGALTASLRPGMNVLDVACGTGDMARRLLSGTDGSIEFVLLDASRTMLEICADIPATRVLGCMTNLPFAENSFDLLTCTWGIETISETQSALSEFVRVTRSGGYIFLVYCADRPTRSLFGMAMRHHIALTGRGQFLSQEALCEQAAAARVKRMQPLYCNGPAAAMILHI